MADFDIDVRILGPFEFRVNGRNVAARQPKQRALLALLALRAGSPVAMSEAVDGLWDGASPSGARNQIQVYVSGLRRILADAGVPRPHELITTHAGGYLLSVPAQCVDLNEFDRAVRDGGRLARAGDLTVADETLQKALRRWRGRPFADLPGRYFEQLADQLQERWLAVVEQHMWVRLQLGDYLGLANALRPAVASHPLHEGLRHGFMLALYHAGRPAEALAAYREGRSRIIEELGIEPGPRLRALELCILGGEPAAAAAQGRP